ncbi:hypothetical protein BKA70DRAFT_1270845, partial [Coprinopsis sp. MPI-PUGE-AT-0042]
MPAHEADQAHTSTPILSPARIVPETVSNSMTMPKLENEREFEEPLPRVSRLQNPIQATSHQLGNTGPFHAITPTASNPAYQRRYSGQMPNSSPIRSRLPYQLKGGYEAKNTEDLRLDEDRHFYYSSPPRMGYLRQQDSSPQASMYRPRNPQEAAFSAHRHRRPAQEHLRPQQTVAYRSGLADDMCQPHGRPMFPLSSMRPPMISSSSGGGPAMKDEYDESVELGELNFPPTSHVWDRPSLKSPPSSPAPQLSSKVKAKTTIRPKRLSEANNNHAFPTRTTLPPAKRPRALNAYAFGSSDPDEEWSTLRPPKKAKTDSGVKSTGFFQIPGLVPSISPEKTRKSGVAADSDRRVITFLPPPAKKPAPGPPLEDSNKENEVLEDWDVDLTAYPSPGRHGGIVPERGRSQPSKVTKKSNKGSQYRPLSPPTSEPQDVVMEDERGDGSVRITVDPSSFPSRYVKASGVVRRV